MTEARRTSAYLGPQQKRWTPASWTDVVEAAKGGLLDESHWVDLKREVAAGKASVNTDLAKDLASLAVDGGLLIIGIEDHDSHAGAVCGTPMAGLADRIDQIARDKVRPSLTVGSHPIENPDAPGTGCLLVHVPPSPYAPHMVDYTYYGRSDRANMRLADEQVRAIISDRSRARTDVLDALGAMATHDPITPREYGHLYLLAEPDTAPAECLVDFLERRDAHETVNRMLGGIRAARGADLVEPDLVNLPQSFRRPQGTAFTTLSPDYRPYERSALDLEVREDGGVRLTCGAGVITETPERLRHETTRVVYPGIVRGLTRSFVAFVGALSDEHAAYQGQWQLALRIDAMNDACSGDALRSFTQRVIPYAGDSYERTTTATTEELVTAPADVAGRLVNTLLRSLGIPRSAL
ncbi:ATP-binding protein [Amycolatopsis sp. NPDC024027]|uniref:AlbA family DNA-binding domain-containing protein n=1 Tax=Amycolatopsis sp. NPDC024027 TaxID=3154327 RepID=UPI0034055FA0